MSRSYRKTPVTGFSCSKSEKKDKQIYNRRFRRAIKREIFNDILPDLREVSDVWQMTKDGKQRFDPEKHPELMRK